MKNLFKKLKLYIPFSKAGIKGIIVYKAQIFMWLFISFVDVFFVIFLYQAIYRNSLDGINSVINGFTFYDMVLYMVTSFVFSFVITFLTNRSGAIVLHFNVIPNSLEKYSCINSVVIVFTPNGPTF